jgi:hypothetical protein
MTGQVPVQTPSRGRSFGRFVQRGFELFWILLATLAALFFYKTAKDKTDENEILTAELRRNKMEKKDDDKCTVCLSNPLEIVVQPCGHVCLCRDCSQRIGIGQYCPICRHLIERTHVVYLS